MSSVASKRLPWVMPPALLPLWYAGVAWSWWRVFHHELSAAPPAPPAAMPPAAFAVWLAMVGKVLGHLSEAAFYVLLWRARNQRLPFWRFFAVVVSASLADPFAHAIAVQADPGAVEAWRPWIAGAHLASGTVFHDSPAVRAAFGSVGLVTLCRIGITAAAQARALSRGFAETTALTVAVWLLSRIAGLWRVDWTRAVTPGGGG